MSQEGERDSLAAGLSRRHRFARNRAGTGRQVTRRSLGLVTRRRQSSESLFRQADEQSEDEPSKQSPQATDSSGGQPEISPPRRSPRVAGTPKGHTKGRFVASAAAAVDNTPSPAMPSPSPAGGFQPAMMDSPELFNDMSDSPSSEAKQPERKTTRKTTRRTTTRTTSGRGRGRGRGRRRRGGRVTMPRSRTTARTTTKSTSTTTGKKRGRKPGRKPRTATVVKQETKEPSGEDLTEDKIYSVPNEQTGGRYPKRIRYKRLAFWKGERVNYERRASIVNGALPTVKVEQPFIPGPASPPTRRRKPRKRTVKVEEDSSDSESSDSDLSEPKRRRIKRRKTKRWKPVSQASLPPFQMAWVLGPNNALERKATAIRANHIHLTRIQNGVMGAPAPYAGKAFQADNRWVSAGLLILPPLAVKSSEITRKFECFYVDRAAAESLHVQVCPPVDERSEKKFTAHLTLSQGDFFYIPPNNVYALRNEGNKPVKLVFTLASSRPSHGIGIGRGAAL